MSLKLYYAAGPGDVVGTFRHWLRGESEPQQLALTYSEQFFSVARRLRARAWVVSSCDRLDVERGENLTVENRPRLRGRGALSYWLDQFVYGVKVLWDLVRIRPRVAIIAEGTCPWIMLLLPYLLGVKIVPSMHCVLWPPGRPPRGLRRAWMNWEGAGFRYFFDATLCASQVVAHQIERIAPGVSGLRQFLPTYRLALFGDTMEPSTLQKETKLLYAGRIEDDKGVFDLVEAMAVLERQAPGRYLLDFCGNGAALDRLREVIAAKGLNDRVNLRGHCTAEVLRGHLASCHLVIVPTSSRFVEGFNQVVAEGVLAGRPVVATSVCPSALLFSGAVRVIDPDQPGLMAEAIREIAQNDELYQAMHQATFQHRDELFSYQHSWEKAVTDVIRDLAGPASEATGLGYLVPQFPSQTHAFFWRELTALREFGVDVTVLSTREPSRDACSHAFAEDARRQTEYLNRVELSTLGVLLARPVGVLRCLRYIAALSDSTAREKIRVLLLMVCAARLVECARNKGLRHIHIHSCADAAHIGALGNCLDGLPYSLTLHGDLPVYGKDHAKKFRLAKWVSAVTRPLHRQIVEMTGTPAPKVPVIWMGVDTGSVSVRTRWGNLDGSIRMITVARLIAQKGHLDALAAIADVRRRGVDIRYVIAGSGPFEAEILDEIGRLDLGGVVTMAGNLSEDQVREALAESDLFVLPSYGLGEAAPVSVMEAMASGLPVISTRIGGTPDMINHLEDGWLTAQRNVEDLADAIYTLGQDPHLRTRLGLAGRRKAEVLFDHRTNAGRLLGWINGESVGERQVPLSGQGKLLLIMEQCNPIWPSVPRVAYEIYRHLSEITPVTLVTHARNRDGLLSRMPDAEIHFIEESPGVSSYYHCVSKMVGGRGTNWPLLHALGYPVFAEFDRKVTALFGERVRSGEYRAVMAATPILPRYPYSIASCCSETPFILGPVNGGLPFPKGFGRIALQEHAAFNFLRHLGRLLPGYAETYRGATRILVGSEYTLGWLKGVFPEAASRLTWMPENGVSRSFFTGANRPKPSLGPLKLLFAGRLVPYKGADILLDALALAKAKLKRPFQLRIVGDGPMRETLAKQAARLGIGDAVEFSGLVPPDQMPEEFRSAHLFCFPSIREFGGAVVLEAMAGGAPCVVVDHGGVGEYVTPSCGIKVVPESRDHLVAAFAEALERLSCDPALLEAMSRAAVARAEEFSWEAKVRRIARIIEEAVEERSDPQSMAA
jgi:glycosyltransferase involved in cell wall biosynthesis